MADTALKFGPEWLRALTEPQGEGGGVITPLSNIKLAEFRYGKEEILALFDKNVKPPEEIVNFGTLFVEKCQYPLNLMQMTEDESRAWQRGANSDTSQRQFGAPGKRPPSPTGGRGRGRGRAGAPYYDRNRSMDEELLEGGVRRGGGIDVSGERGFSRGGSGVRNGIGGYERQTSERGGWFDRQQSRDEDVNGGVSPRKGYTRAPFDDWRRGGDNNGDAGAGGPQEPGDGWRTSGNRRWGGAGAGLASGQGWRTDRENYNRTKFGENSSSRPQTNDRWRRDDESRGFNRGGGQGYNRQKSRNDDHLPEWATDDPSEGGSFDTEGKFRSDQLRNGGVKNGDDWGGDDNSRWEDEEVDPEDVVEDDINSDISKAINHSCEEARISNHSSASVEKEESLEDSSSLHNPSSEMAEPDDKSPLKNQDASTDLETMAGSIVASLVDEEELPPHQESPPSSKAPPVVPSPPPPGHTWSYLDPQGQVQGPFQSDEMLEWYSAGYFPPDLMLRRSCDKRYVPLKDLERLYSRVPFTPGPSPPPLVDNQEEERLKQLQQQQLLHQQQLLMQQQLLAQQQQQQHQHMMGMGGHGHPGGPGGPSPDLSKLLHYGGQQPPQHHSLGSLGLSRGFPDPRLNLLGNLGGPSLSEPPANDPLKQLLARNQSGPTMPTLGGRPFSNNSPPMVPQPQDNNQIFPQSLFGNISSQSQGLNPVVASEPPPHHNIPFSKPPSNSSAVSASGGGANFDPIQSLLAQLQNSTSQPSSPQLLRGQVAPPSDPEPVQFHHHRQGQSVWDLPPSEPEPPIMKQQQQPPPSQQPPPVVEAKPMTSIWNDPVPPVTTIQHQSESPISREIVHQDNIEPADETIEDFDHSEANSQEFDHSPIDTDSTSFVKPKANEKKDKKSKKAEEKRKAKEAKKAAEAAGPYIPGMSGSVRPDEQIVATGNIIDLREEEKLREQQEAYRRQREQMEALAKLQEDQKLKLEREEQLRIQQEKLSKLAPWAKKETSPIKEPGSGMTMQEIQRLEAEREKKERQAREVQEARMREEQRRLEQEEQAKRAAKTINWATAAAPVGGKVKSLAEIQAEEARVERERQERELLARNVRTKDPAPGNHGNPIWGGGSSGKGATWAGKIAANTPATPSQTRSNANNAWSSSNGQSAAAVVAPAGFWDPVIPDTPQQVKKQVSSSNINNNQVKNNKNQKKKDDEGKGGKKSKNEFEDWCTKALHELQAQVDIPTFLGFLMDIESPYDVHDYVKSYVGEGKAQKKFATDYLERRSRWKNSLKSGARYEDDLFSTNTVSPGDGEFQEAGKKGKNKKLTKQSKSKQDISHLLGFSVQGQGVNRGELDMPQ